MGVRDLLLLDPVVVARKMVDDPVDLARRDMSDRRMLMYQDNSAGLVQGEILRTFDSPFIRELIQKILPLAASPGLFKRLVDEQARSVYSRAPVREVTPDGASTRYKEIVKSARVNQKMDWASRIVQASNDCLIYCRFVERLERIVVDVIPPGSAIVIEDPDLPSQPLAVMYKKANTVVSGSQDTWVYWDDAETFELSGSSVFNARAHDLGRIPFVAIHRQERSDKFWDSTSGSDMEAAHLSVSLLWALVLRLHKAQGWRQLVITGDLDSIPQQQILAEEGPLIMGAGVTATSLDLATPPDHYLRSIEAIVTNVGANHGISRNRLNLMDKSKADDAALMELRAQGIKIFQTAEHDLFELLKVISREDPAGAIGDDAELVNVDFPELSTEVDRMEQLKIREEEERMGLRTRLDDIIEDQPEMDRDAAESEYLANLKIRQWRVEAERALNMPQLEDQPVERVFVPAGGLTPEQNGRMGPLMRDNNLIEMKRPDGQGDKK